MKRKGQRSLTMVVTFIILLVVAGVVINLFLNTIGGGVKNPKEVRKKDITADCEMQCREITESESTTTRRDAIIEYCQKNFKYDVSDVESDISYGRPLGRNSFCIDKARCFNLNFVNCIVGGREVGAEMCRNVMCKRYKRLGLDQETVEDKIERHMSPGNCRLEKGSQVGDQRIEVKTWWERYFKNINCTRFY